MYMNYKNLLKKQNVLSIDTMEEYKSIKKIGTYYQTKNGLQDIKKAVFTNAQIRFADAKRFLQRKNHYFQNIPLCLNNHTKKWLLLTTITFPNDAQFLNILSYFGISLENCKEFSNQIETFIPQIPNMKDPNDELEWILVEYLDIHKLQDIRKYYNLNNMEVIINKILEISYIHPELLNTKQK